MSASAQRLAARIGRWPRRIAALACLVLAAGSALVPQPAATSTAPEHRNRARLRAGEVAVPVPISSPDTADLRPGAVVGVLAAPADTNTAAPAVLVADHLRVLSVRSGGASLGDASTVVVLATDRSHALQLTRYANRRLLLIVDEYPTP